MSAPIRPRSAALQQHLSAGGSALLAVNINDQYDLRAAAAAANRAGTPLIMMVSLRAIEHAGLATLAALFHAEQAASRVPLWLELDHATNVCLMRDCIAAGFDVIMADFSAHAPADNVARTRDVVCMAHAAGVLVEGEVDTVPDHAGDGARRRLTSPSDARDFAADTGVDLLAVAVGNIHGFSRSKPPLDIELIERIATSVATPLVLHGADYYQPTILAAAVAAGVRKVNIGPELREAYCDGLRSAIERSDRYAPDHRIVLNAAATAVENGILARIASMQP